MKTIRNTTSGSIRVPLPRGKTLHLGPRKSGEIAANAETHPPLVKLVEAGTLEILAEGHHEHTRASSAASVQGGSTQAKNPAVTSHHRGER